MPIAIRCHYIEYIPPPNANWLDWTIITPLCETFGLPFSRQTRHVTITTEPQTPALNAGLELAIDAATLQRSQPARFRVSKLNYFVNNGMLETEAELIELKPPPIQRWYANLSDLARVAIAAATILSLFFLTAFAFYAVTNYPQPIDFWAWVGKNIRGGLTMILGISFLSALVWSNRGGIENSWVQDIANLLFGTLAIGAPMGWWMASEPNQAMTGSPQVYIDYLNQLISQWQTLTPMLIGLLPWATMIFKWMGWDMVSSVMDTMGKSKSK
jgi:hypothetical protein